MDLLGTVFEMLGAALNGAIQVFTDFINLIIVTVPNPDPFPQVIEEMPVDLVIDMGYVWYWIDCFVGIDGAIQILDLFVVLWLASLTFAVIYKIAGFIKG